MGYLTHSSNVVLELGLCADEQVYIHCHVGTDRSYVDSNDATGEYVYMNIYAMTLEIKSLMIYISLRILRTSCRRLEHEWAAA